MTTTMNTTMNTAAMVSLVLVGALAAGTPARAHAQTQTRTQRVQPAADTLAFVRAPRRSWTTDRREFAVGDLLTVLVDESTLASASADNHASSRRSHDASFGIGGTSAGKALGGIKATFGTENNAQSSNKGDATRENQFTSELSVRVTAVDSAGRLQIQGRKVVTIDKNVQEITLSGWVRPEDVSAYNTVSSARVADAELVYGGKAKLAKPHQGLISRILGALWP